MGRVKNQHFVPRSYLERFEGPSGKIFVFDKSRRRVFQTGKDNIASEQGFYDLPPDVSADMQAVEKTFCKVEGDAKGAIDGLLAELDRDGRFDARNEERRAILATFVALQDSRTRTFRQTYGQMHDQLQTLLTRMHEAARKHHAAKGEMVEGQPVDLGIPPPRLAVEHAKIMFSPEFLMKSVGAITSHIWLVARNDTPQPLYTSDCPVSRFAHVPNHRMGGSGLASLGVEICLPLTPRYVLVLCERTYFQPRLPVPEGGVIPLNPEGVRHYNARQIYSGRLHIYCNEDKFDHVREAASQNPEVFDPERQRFEVKNGME